MTAKHRRFSRRSKKFATLGVATITAATMTVGMAPAPTAETAVSRSVALAAATGPNYTQLVTDWSNSLNNVLFTAGNLGGAAAGLWDPLAAAVPGGLLPTFTAGTTQNDLTSLAGLLAALSQITVPDLSGVPGLPPNATTILTAGLLPGLVPALGVLGPVTAQALAGLGAVNGVLTLLNNINIIRQALNLPLISGIPTLGDLIPGLTVTQTEFNSAYDWPLLGLGAILGLNGSTNISNTFAQIPSLTGSALVTSILSGLNINGLPLTGSVATTVGRLLAPLNAINTPSVTAWIPSGSGNYGLPLGGSVGWLATMPTLAVGPVAVGPVVLSDTDTVIAIPLVAAGAVLPLGIASFGTVGTPGVVFPTATGVSTLGGTSLTSFSVPLLGLGVTNLNLLSATYVGTNGINYNSGTSLLTLTTPFGAFPIVYSLGAYNLGTTGFGFTLPSLFTIGLLPSFQVGTAPTQQSPDGLIPASVLNLGLGLPTQTTNLATMLGLPDPGALVTPILNPAFNLLIAPFGAQLTNALNTNAGPLANGLARLMAQLTALLAQASAAVTAPVTPTTMLAASPQPSVTSVPDPAPQTINVASVLPTNPQPTPSSTPTVTAAAAIPDPEEEPETTRPRLNVITGTPNPVGTALENGRNQLSSAVTNTQKQVETAVGNAQTQVTGAVTNVVKSVVGAVGSLGSPGSGASTTADSTAGATP